MRLRTQILSATLLVATAGAYGQTQSTPADQPAAAPEAQTSTTPQPHSTSAGGDMARGTGEVGKGAAKGAGHAAQGVGKGAGDLVTLHPVDAVGAVCTGAAKTTKDVTAGTAKGTGKIVKGTGKAVKNVF